VCHFSVILQQYLVDVGCCVCVTILCQRVLFRHAIYHRLCDGRIGEAGSQVSSCIAVTTFVIIFHKLLCCAFTVCFETYVKSKKIRCDVCYRDASPIIGRFADNRYRPISTLVSADCRLHNW